MPNPVAELIDCSMHSDPNVTWKALKLWCPGCETRYAEDGIEAFGGLHMLPVNTTSRSPQWAWNGDLVKVTLTPSILIKMSWKGGEFICHSFLTNGIWNFLQDSTHRYAGQSVPLPPLPYWVLRDSRS